MKMPVLIYSLIIIMVIIFMCSLVIITDRVGNIIYYINKNVLHTYDNCVHINLNYREINDDTGYYTMYKEFILNRNDNTLWTIDDKVIWGPNAFIMTGDHYKLNKTTLSQDEVNKISLAMNMVKDDESIASYKYYGHINDESFYMDDSEEIDNILNKD